MARPDYLNAGTLRRSVKGGRGRPRLAGFAKPASILTLEVDPGTVQPGETSTVELVVPGLNLIPWRSGRHGVVTEPPADLEAGLVALAPTVSADDTVSQPIYNSTLAPIVAEARDWRVLFFAKA